MQRVPIGGDLPLLATVGVHDVEVPIAADKGYLGAIGRPGGISATRGGGQGRRLPGAIRIHGVDLACAVGVELFEDDLRTVGRPTRVPELLIGWKIVRIRRLASQGRGGALFVMLVFSVPSTLMVKMSE